MQLVNYPYRLHVTSGVKTEDKQANHTDRVFSGNTKKSVVCEIKLKFSEARKDAVHGLITGLLTEM